MREGWLQQRLARKPQPSVSIVARRDGRWNFGTRKTGRRMWRVARISLVVVPANLNYSVFRKLAKSRVSRGVRFI